MNPQNQQLGQLPQEDIIFKIKRHPIGIVAVYITSAVLLIALAVVAFGVAPKYITSVNSTQVYEIATVGYLIFLAIVLTFVYVAHLVFWDNSWTLSTESLTQVTRTSLFDKQSSHLSLGNLQDVTASQEGILPHIFNYGSLRVETAGETSKFVFNYCPNPNTYAEYILEAREKFEQGLRMLNNGLQSPSQTANFQTPAVPEEQPTYPIPPQPPDTYVG